MAVDVWYFAYGSNLDAERKEFRTGTIRKFQRVRAPGFRFAFNKAAGDGTCYANIVADDSHEVWGVIYLCSPEAMERMDGYEGVKGGHYERASIQVIREDGTVVEAVTYVAGPRYLVGEGKPQPDYLRRIVKGARAYGLPQEYINEVQALGTAQQVQ
jgi:cation transport regulator ChaC